MEDPIVFFSFKILGYPVDISLVLVTQWVIIAIVSIICILGTRRLKQIPDKKQNIFEIIVNIINNLVIDNMGEENKSFVPFIGTMAIFILLMNLTGLFGIEAPTESYSVPLAMAIISFLTIQGFAIKKNGLFHYFGAYAKPKPFMLVLNVMERVMTPVSLSLRLFGNMMAGGIIISLVYGGLRKISWFAQIGAPIPLHGYFDLFDGTVQMIIFVMLTMINIKIISEE